MGNRAWQGARALTALTTCLLCRAQIPDTAAVPPPAPAPLYKLVFNDEFNSLDLSPDGSGVHTWYKDVWFNHVPAPLADISASNSVLTLAWLTNQSSFDTSITTLSGDRRQAHAWQYGYFEARMKWDVVKGAWPAFWLIPVEDAQGRDTYNGVKESGEIDIFEGQGDQPTTYFGSIHDWVNLKGTSNADNHFPLPSGFDFSQFHSYGLLWEPGKVTWYLDDRALHSESTYAIFDKQHFFMVLSMKEGANWKEGDTTGVTAQQMTLQVDWVRVWQK